jgi:CheY-like chemotaxis protein
MGGEIGIKSTVDEGSTFWFTLPRLRLPIPEPEIDLSEVNLSRVLIADDHEINRTLMKQQLADWGIETTCVGTGDDAIEALELAHREKNPYDLVIIDYVMPDVDGAEVGRRIRSKSQYDQIPLIAMGSNTYREQLKQLCRKGFQSVLTKPLIRPRLLAEAVTIALKTIKATKSDTTTKPEIAAETKNTSTPIIKHRILLVEDQVTNQRLATILLEKLGCRVDHAANGIEAVEMASKLPYDAIFMDCQMPEMDGFDATIAIRQREEKTHGSDHRVPIIALTAGAMKGDREECIAAGMDDYVTKPLRANDLTRIIAMWCEGEADSQLEAAIRHY